MRNDTKKRKRGRPREFSETEARGRILERFWEQGYAASSLDDLSAATGMGRPSLYAAFGNKEAMYLAALDQFKGRFGEGVRAMMASPDGRTGLAAFYRAALDTYLSGEGGPRGCLVVCTASAEAPGSPAIRGALAGVLEELDQALEGFFRRFHGPEQARARGRLAASFLHSLAVRARAGEPEPALEELIALAVELLS